MRLPLDGGSLLLTLIASCCKLQGPPQVLRFYNKKCADIQEEADKLQATASKVTAAGEDSTSESAGQEVG